MSSRETRKKKKISYEKTEKFIKKYREASIKRWEYELPLFACKSPDICQFSLTYVPICFL